MDRDNRRKSVSPYLLRPLRSMVQAMRELAVQQQGDGVKPPEPQPAHVKTPREGG